MKRTRRTLDNFVARFDEFHSIKQFHESSTVCYSMACFRRENSSYRFVCLQTEEGVRLIRSRSNGTPTNYNRNVGFETVMRMVIQKNIYSGFIIIEATFILI